MSTASRTAFLASSEESSVISSIGIVSEGAIRANRPSVELQYTNSAPDALTSAARTGLSSTLLVGSAKSSVFSDTKSLIQK